MKSFLSSLVLLLLAFASFANGSIYSSDAEIGGIGDISFSYTTLHTNENFDASFDITLSSETDVVQDVAWTFTMGGEEQASDVVTVPIASGTSTTTTIDVEGLSVESAGKVDFVIDITYSFSGDTTNEDGFSESSTQTKNVIEAGTSLIPLLLVLVLAIASQNVFFSLYSGIWLGSFIIADLDFIAGFQNSIVTYIIPALADEGHVYIIVFSAWLSGVVGMILKSGGAQGFADAITKYAAGTKTVQYFCIVCGMVLFIDDYANALIVGGTFRPITDAFMISREKLAFLVDATSAPTVSIMPLSSWIAFEVGLIQDSLDQIIANNGGEIPEGLTESGFLFFIETIPTRFYPIFMIALQFTLVTLGFEFGPMLFIERFVRVKEITDGGPGKLEKIEGAEKALEADEGTPKKWWNLVVPILFLVAVLLAVMINTGIDGLDGAEPTARNIFESADSFSGLVYSTLGTAIFFMFFLLIQFKHNGKMVAPSLKYLWAGKDADVPRPFMYFFDSLQAFIAGNARLAEAIMVLILAWSIGSIMGDLGADRFFSAAISGSISPAVLPSIIFLMSALVALCSGTSWGTMTIMFNLIGVTGLELVEGDATLYTMLISSIMSGAVLGDHLSPISDTTILSSIGSSCDIFRHVWTQIPYGIFIGVISVVFGLLPAGAGAEVGGVIVLGLLSIIILVPLFGAPIMAKSGRFDPLTELILKCLKSTAYGKRYNKLREETIQYIESNPASETPECKGLLMSCFGKKSTEEVKQSQEILEVKKIEEAAEVEEEVEEVEEADESTANKPEL